MDKGEQVDKMSKRLVKLSRKEIAFAKRQHKRYIRRKAKDIDAFHPLTNRYSGYIGQL